MISDDSEKPVFRIKAELMCGAIIEIVQSAPNMNLKITVDPPSGIAISDLANITDNKLNLRVTTEALLGLYQVLGDVFGYSKSRKKLFGVF
jgi:hypothetical protein